MAGRRRPRRLTDEDRALWARVAASARPLDPAKSDGDPPPAPAPAAAPPQWPVPQSSEKKAALPGPQPKSRSLRPTGRPASPVSWAPPADDRPAPVGRRVPGLDAGTARRLARGRREPEAQLDLHGMTLERAHRALTRFIFDSRSIGLRCVLVVTGKGRGPDGGRGEGVLRRDVPRWLRTHLFDDAVVNVFEAHPKHGGAGALYVYLKRRR